MSALALNETISDATSQAVATALAAAAGQAGFELFLTSINQMFIVVLLTFIVHLALRIEKNNWKPINLLLLGSSFSWLSKFTKGVNRSSECLVLLRKSRNR
jgi:uncharacterized membrane protein YgaE (UPF0421/DUF939 family)